MKTEHNIRDNKIEGDYPCCGAELSIPLLDLGHNVYWKELCDTCLAPVWHKATKDEPATYTEKEFLKYHTHCPDTGEIRSC